MAIKINNELTKQINKVTLATAGKFVDQDIEVNNEVKSAGFSNQKSTSKTYTKDPSSIPVIPASGSLFIDAGWVDDIEISLGHLIPDDTNLENAGSDKILEGFEAYDSDGNKLVGTIKEVNPTVSGGGVTATASGSVTTAPSVTINPKTTSSLSSYGVTIDSIQGTEGTDFISIANQITESNGTVTAKANATRSLLKYNNDAVGHINKNGATVLAAGNATENTKTITVDPSVSNKFPKYNIPIIKPSFNGGGISGSITLEQTTTPNLDTNIILPDNAANIGLTEEAQTTDSAYSITVAASMSSGVITASGNINREAVTCSNNAGIITAKDNTTALSSTSKQLSTETINISPNSANPKTIYLIKGAATTVPEAPAIVHPGAEARTDVTLKSTGSAITGVLTTPPTDSDYIIIKPHLTTTAGNAKSKAYTRLNKGTITGGNTGTITGSAAAIYVNDKTSSAARKYIAIYDGSYTIG